MKKSVFLLGLCLVFMLLSTSGAMALQAPYIHGDFGHNSSGCGECHVTHSANVAKLLKWDDSSGWGNTQTAFCLGCHGSTSPFNVRYGMVMKQSNENTGATTIAARFPWGGPDPSYANMSLAGGFEYSGRFQIGSTAFDLVDDMDHLVTSVHNVRGIEAAVPGIPNVTSYEYVYGNTIPGGSKSLDFECGSCHDPHAGGPYPDAGKNPRLLKKEILGTTGLDVVMDIDQDQNLPTKYVSGFNKWCGACHDVFDTSSYGANVGILPESSTRTGYNLLGGRTKYMHLFGIDVATNVYGGSTVPYTVEWLALQNNKTDGSGTQTELMCLTCHRAHGSSAVTSNVWTRYSAYKSYTGSGTTSSGEGSALLRLPNRDVCFGCHGAAQFNHSDTHSP